MSAAKTRLTQEELTVALRAYTQAGINEGLAADLPDKYRPKHLKWAVFQQLALEGRISSSGTPDIIALKNREEIDKVFHEIEDLFVGLAGRWQDESQYEDIAEYGEVLEKQLPEHFWFREMSKRPFGLKFTLRKRHYHILLTGRQYSWKRVAS